MKRKHNLGEVALILLILAAAHRAPAASWPIQAVSVASPTLSPSNSGNGDSRACQITADGGFAVFVSGANNLVTNEHTIGPLLPFLNVFLRDLKSGKTTLVSSSAEGNDSGDGNSNYPTVSADGRFIAFESEASNLVTNDLNGATDVFVRDLNTGQTILVTANSSGSSSGNDASGGPIISSDGRYVAFTSAASDLVPGDTNGIPDVFVRDLQTGTTTLISAGATDPTGRGLTSEPVDLTPDGRFVLFTSTADGLAPGATNGLKEIYIGDTTSQTTTRVSHNVAALLGPSATSFGGVISSNGQFVAFKAHGSETNGPTLLWHDLQSGTTTIITNAVQGDPFISADDSGPHMSLNGRYVCHTAQGPPSQVYVWDSQTGSNVLVSAR